MQLTICAVGRMKNGPEKLLIDDYLQRAERSGKSQGIGPVRVIEVENKKPTGKSGEADLLRNAIPDGAWTIALDERGKTLTSPEFANLLANLRLEGARDCTFVIGGADGIAKELRQETSQTLSFGKMVWPHMLARVMLAEQIYRAVSILSGSPYHRA